MKTIKTLICAAAAIAALTFSATNAQAFIGTVTNYDVLNWTIIIQTNIPGVVENETNYVQKIGTEKFSNKQLLALLETKDFYNGTFPDGAMIVVGWDQEWNGDVLVVDQTGTNVIFNASASDTAYVDVDYIYYYGANSENYSADLGKSGHDDYVANYEAYWQVYDNNSLTVEFGSYSPDTETYDQNFTTSKTGATDYTTWSDTESMNVDSSGGYEIYENLNGYDNLTTSGTIDASGHGKGSAYYIYQNI